MPNPIIRLNAALEGRYRIERELGEGGMATVYLAADVKHGRKVALKILKPELAAVVGAERFLAEIKTTANLTHPHILPLHDSGEADGFLFFVIPYIEGDTLRDKIDREKQLSVAEALEIAKKVALALDYAHKHGVVHRDIKPANILLSAEGEPTIADFGIALAVAQAGGGRVTETGLSVGTPHYMSPEQATGDRDVDPRTDIYALGCVLYEMLIGEPPYTGSTAQAILGKIIQGKPISATEARGTVPPNVDAAIRKALEKLPADRFASAQAFAKALADPGFRHGGNEVVVVAGRGLWNPLSIAASAVAAIATLAFAWYFVRPEPPQPVERFQVDAFSPGTLEGVSLLPDGTGMVHGTGPLMLRRWTSLQPVPIPGTEGAFLEAVVSPTSDEVAFLTATGELSVVPLPGGVVRRLAEGAFCCIRWGTDGFIYFSPQAVRNIQRVPAMGGEVEDVTTREAGSGTQGYFQILPGGDIGVFTSNWALSGGQIEAIRLSTGERRVLTPGIKSYVTPTGHLVFSSVGGQILGASFDADAMELMGSAFPLIDDVYVNLGAIPAFSLSDDGRLVYVEAGQGGAIGTSLVVRDLEGNQQVLPPALSPAISWVGWSPDGASVAYNDLADGQIYTYNVELGTTPRQITFEGVNAFAQYSPDGTRLAFSSAPEGSGVAAISVGATNVYVKNLNDTSEPRLVATLEGDQWLTQWLSDTQILFEWGPRAGSPSWDLGVLDFADPGSPSADLYLTSQANLRDLTVSPDGRVAAYRSNESGQDQIYVRSFPEPGAQTLISQDGGTAPFWSPDGNTLYFARGNGDGSFSFFAARLQRDPVTVVVSTDSLFTGTYAQPFSGAGLHPDGDRWILAQPVGNAQAGGEGALRVILVQNFFEELNRLVPVD